MKLISILFLIACTVYAKVATDTNHYSDAVRIDAGIGALYQTTEYKVSIRTTTDGFTNCFITWPNEYFASGDIEEDYLRLLASIASSACVLGESTWHSDYILIGFLDNGYMCTVSSAIGLAINSSRMSDIDIAQWVVDNLQQYPVSSIFTPPCDLDQSFDSINSIRPEIVFSTGITARNRIITSANLSTLSYREIKLVRNYAYACYNRPFATAWIRDFFINNMPSYSGSGSSNPNLTNMESSNITRIQEYESANNIPVITQ